MLRSNFIITNHFWLTKGESCHQIATAIGFIGVISGIITGLVLFGRLGPSALGYATIGIGVGILFLYLRHKIEKKIEKVTLEENNLIEQLSKGSQESHDVSKFSLSPFGKKLQSEMSNLLTKNPVKDVQYLRGSVSTFKIRSLKNIFQIIPDVNLKFRSKEALINEVIVKNKLHLLQCAKISEHTFGENTCFEIENPQKNCEIQESQEMISVELVGQLATFICQTGFFQLDHMFYFKRVGEYKKDPPKMLIAGFHTIDDLTRDNRPDISKVVDGLFGQRDTKIEGLLAMASHGRDFNLALKIIALKLETHFFREDIIKELSKRPYYESIKTIYPSF